MNFVARTRLALTVRRFAFVAASGVLALLSTGRQTCAGMHLEPLRTVHSINSMSNTEAKLGYPVELDGVVTYSDPEWGLLFLQDKTGAIYVNVHGVSTSFPPGSRVRVNAVTASGDVAPVLAKARVNVLGDSSLPKPAAVTVEQLNSGAEDSKYVETEGVLRPGNQPWNRICFRIFDGTDWALVIIPQNDNAAASRLVGARVRVTGVTGSRLDGTGVRLGAQVFVSRLADVELVETASQNDINSAAQPIGTLSEHEADMRFVPQVHVRGTVTWERAGLFFADDGSGAIGVTAADIFQVHPGTMVDVFGFPTRGEHGLLLSDATVKALGMATGLSHISPVRSSVSGVLNGFLDHRQVQLQGRLVEQTDTPSEHIFLLTDGGRRFRATLSRKSSAEEVVSLPRNALLELTGIALIGQSPKGSGVTLTVLICSPKDVVVIEGNAWFTIKRLLTVAGAIGVLAIAILIWITQLRRTVRAQTATIRARLERECISRPNTSASSNEILRKCSDGGPTGQSSIAMRRWPECSASKTVPKLSGNPIGHSVSVRRKTKISMRRSQKQG